MMGKIAGVRISSDNGDPGSGGSVQIRGVGSISAGTSPLYVIDGVLDELAGVLGEDLTSGLVMTAARVAGVREDDLALELVAGEANLVGVDDDDVVATVDVGREVRFVLSTDDLRDLRSEASEYLIRSVDEQPLLVDVGLVGRNGLVA